jgi:lysophospholipase L1-like esterase
VCGDGTCEGGEDCGSCAADCGTCPPVCGDGTCDPGEDCASCAADCTCSSTPTKLAGIGNSIMQAYNARSNSSPLAGDTPSASFAQGTDATPYSLYQRYQDAYGLPGGMQFVSVSGAEWVGGSDNAAAQAAAICAQAVKPDRVVIELGGNDVCNRGSGLSDPMARVAAMYTDEQIGNAVSAALDQLGQCLPANARVHVLGIPRVDGLYDAGISQGCQGRWNRYLIFFPTNICRIVTGGSLGTGNSTLQARDAVGARIDGYNDELAARVAAAQAGYAVDFSTDWVGSMAQGMLNTSVGAYQFQSGDLSNGDCFHPYYSSGHVKLACAAWESWEGDPANVPACLQ